VAHHNRPGIASFVAVITAHQAPPMRRMKAGNLLYVPSVVSDRWNRCRAHRLPEPGRRRCCRRWRNSIALLQWWHSVRRHCGRLNRHTRPHLRRLANRKTRHGDCGLRTHHPGKLFSEGQSRWVHIHGCGEQCESASVHRPGEGRRLPIPIPTV
jgi:hypothetical protein